MLVWIAGAALFLAALPAGLCLLNLFLFRVPRARAGGSPWPVSVLIPARDEEARIGKTLDAVLADPNPQLELVVMDDHSTDRTAELVRERAARDPRVRLEVAPPLGPGWNGKQHACAALSRVATHDVLVFLDADVTLEAGALDRIRGALETSGAALVSGFPRQITRTFLERLLIPLVHFVLLGFLPIVAMRRSPSPAFGAGCGQLMVARRSPYADAGGHGAIRESRHDGVKLPRTFRLAGYATDLFDATPMAACRMYQNAGEVWRGLVKNATEGMATPRAILPWTVLLFGGQVLPLVLLVFALLTGAPTLVTVLAGTGVALGLATRTALALRFVQPFDSVLLHPLGVLLLLVVQYEALVRRALRRPVAWRGRGGS